MTSVIDIPVIISFLYAIWSYGTSHLYLRKITVLFTCTYVGSVPVSWNVDSFPFFSGQLSNTPLKSISSNTIIELNG